MNSKTWFLVDAGVCSGLLFALLAVVGLDALLTWLTPAPLQEEGSPALVISSPRQAKRLRLAVTPVYVDQLMGVPWDDVGSLLKSLGDGYRYENFPFDDLRDLDKLRQYDVVFFSCGAGSVDPAITDALRAYVSQGGVLYASDWRYKAVAEAFAEVRAPKLEADGSDPHVDAEVVDRGLRDVLGSDRITLRFELDQWKTAAFSGDRVKVLLRGRFSPTNNRNEKREAPLLVKISFGKGTVIFTSYHHGKHNDDQEKKLLKYLVFSAVTARVESELETIQHKNQFSPAKSNLFSASREAPKVQYAYKNPERGELRFDLGFEEGGAELKLTVTSPSGVVKQQQGKSSLALVISDAEVGTWTYTVTALEVPYENFPFLINVSHGKK
jgi:hypothetical protein